MPSEGLVIPLPRSRRRYLYSKWPSSLRTTTRSSSPTTATSLVPFPDSFKLTLTDFSYKFPHPPILTPSSFRSCASPTSSVSSSYSNPSSRFGTLPPTLSTLDAGYALRASEAGGPGGGLRSAQSCYAIFAAFHVLPRGICGITSRCIVCRGVIRTRAFSSYRQHIDTLLPHRHYFYLFSVELFNHFKKHRKKNTNRKEVSR